MTDPESEIRKDHECGFFSFWFFDSFRPKNIWSIFLGMKFNVLEFSHSSQPPFEMTRKNNKERNTQSIQSHKPWKEVLKSFIVSSVGLIRVTMKLRIFVEKPGKMKLKLSAIGRFEKKSKLKLEFVMKRVDRYRKNTINGLFLKSCTKISTWTHNMDRFENTSRRLNHRSFTTFLVYLKNLKNCSSHVKLKMWTGLTLEVIIDGIHLHQ